MLDIIAEVHRGSLKAGTPEMQKLFVMLKLLPRSELMRTRPSLAFALVIDTSDSMREMGGGASKVDRAMGAAHALLDAPRLAPDDQVRISHLDSSPSAVLPLAALKNTRAAHAAIDSLQNH